MDNKVYFKENDESYSNIELVDNCRMIPKFFNYSDVKKGEKKDITYIFRLCLERSRKKSAILFLSDKDIGKLVTSLNEAYYLKRSSTCEILNKVDKDEYFKYSLTAIPHKINHNRILKININPVGYCDRDTKPSIVSISFRIYCKFLILPLYFESLQPISIKLNQDECENMLFYLASYS